MEKLSSIRVFRGETEDFEFFASLSVFCTWRGVLQEEKNKTVSKANANTINLFILCNFIKSKNHLQEQRTHEKAALASFFCFYLIFFYICSIFKFSTFLLFNFYFFYVLFFFFYFTFSLPLFFLRNFILKMLHIHQIPGGCLQTEKAPDCNPDKRS